MDNHPIPQDVTGFQFKLIGEMTIKQFAYLATGVVSGLLTYLLPISPFVKLPITFLLSFFGISLAFIPLSGRPMDVMVLNFLRALFRPTQFVYQKTDNSLSMPTPSLPEEKKPENNLDRKEDSFFESIRSPSPQILSTHPINPQPTSGENKKPEEKSEVLEKEAETLKKELETVKKEETSLPTQSPTLAATHQKALDLEKELQTVLTEKEQLKNELSLLKRALELQKEKTFAPGVFAKNPPQPATRPQTQNVKQVPRGMEKSVGLPLSPDAPNLVGGILKDPRGNPLPNILVEIKDAEGNAVRAFKTNGLGQFISATPLLSGKYRIEFEDPKSLNRFDAIEFQALGQPILPIEVTSVDQREELRRHLFGV